MKLCYKILYTYTIFILCVTKSVKDETWVLLLQR